LDSDGEKHFDGVLRARPGVGRQVHDRHATLTELAFDLVASIEQLADEGRVHRDGCWGSAFLS